MRRALIISALFHAAIVAIVYFGVPNLFKPDPVVSVPVAVDLVMAPPEAAKPEAPKPPPERKPPPPPPKAKPEPPIPEAPPAIPDPPPMPVLETPAEPPPPPPKPPIPKAEPKPKPKPKPVAAPPPEPAPKVQAARVAPAPKTRPKPPPDRFQALLKDLSTPKPAAPKAAPTETPPKAVPDPLQTAMQRRAVESELTRLVRQQIVPCWNIPAGAKDARDMKIGIRIRLSRDGTLIGAPQLIETSRLSGDPFYRAVAESARRALQNPKCQPLRLPYQQYDIWQNITFNFDPSEALGP